MVGATGTELKPHVFSSSKQKHRIRLLFSNLCSFLINFSLFVLGDGSSQRAVGCNRESARGNSQTRAGNRDGCFTIKSFRDKFTFFFRYLLFKIWAGKCLVLKMYLPRCPGTGAIWLAYIFLTYGTVSVWLVKCYLYLTIQRFERYPVPR